jgi:CRP-like cAMP-binding protein
MKTETPGPSPNRILASLSQTDFSRLSPLLKNVSHEQGFVLQEPGDEVEHIYFPYAGMISLLAVLKEGRAIETATVGREGVVGATAGLGFHIALARAVVQGRWLALKLPQHRSEKPYSKAANCET